MAGARRPVAIVLAAGASTRMGRPKALLPWQGATLLAHQLEQLRRAGIEERIVVVGGSEAAAIADEARRAGAAVAVNERWREGRASSLRAGAAAVPDDADPIVVVSVDQPRPASIIRALLAAYGRRPAAAVVPVHDGSRGHPTLVAGRLLAELRAVCDQDRGLRAVLERHADDVTEAPVDADVIHLDLNTPEDYEAALRASGGS